jgi:hypothetical protein
MSKIKLSLFSICLFCSLFTIAQMEEYNWSTAAPLSELSDSLQEEDAVMLYRHLSIENDVIDIVSYKMKSTTSYTYKIKVLSDYGIDEYSTIYLSENESSSITLLDARTIKKNGEIVDMNSNDIKIERHIDEFDKKVKRLKFTVPGVEIGDEIEVIYRIERNYLDGSGEIHLFSYLPILLSTFNLTFTKELGMEIKTYNGMGKPIEKKTNIYMSYTWKMKNLPGLFMESDAIPTSQLPYVAFVIRNIKAFGKIHPYIANSWESLYEAYLSTYDNPNSVRSPELKSFILKKTSEAKGVLKKFEAIHKYIIENFEIIELDEKEKNKPLFYYVENKRIDDYNLFALYKVIFKTLDTDMYVGFARSKYSGKIDMKFVSLDFITDVFYVFKDENGYIRFIYPPTRNGTYLFDEVPVDLLGTKAVMVYKPSANSLKTTSMELDINAYPLNINTLNSVNRCNLSLSSENLEIKSKLSLKGALSTLYRFDIDKSITDSNTTESSIDLIGHDNTINYIRKTKNNEHYPYESSYIINYDSPISVSYLEDTIASLKLDNIINHTIVQSELEKRVLDLHPETNYSDKIIYYIELDNKNPFTLLNKEQYNISYTSEVGEYSLKIVQVSPLAIQITSKYVIKKAEISKSYYIQLRQLNAEIEKAKQTLIVIKTF